MKSKYLVLSCIATLILFGCNLKQNESNNDERADEELRTAKKNAEESEIVVDTVFLGLKFGMSEKEVKKHLKQLVSSKKLYLSDIGQYTYNLETNLGPIKTKVAVGFHNNQLYKVLLDLESMGHIDNHQLLMYKANDVFKIKADAEGFKCYITKDIDGNHQIDYIKDNLVVTFSSLVYPTMSYVNAPVSKLVKEGKKNKVSEAASDL